MLGLIPARSGSKGVPRKNIKAMAGKPLLAHTVEAAAEAETINRVLVSTDDEEIQSVARSAGAEVPFLRPDRLATDEAATEPVVEHTLSMLDSEEGYTPDAVVLLQPTSPLRDAEDIDEAVRQYRKTDAVSLVSVTVDHSNRWQRTPDSAEQLNYVDAGRRQEKSPEFVENGAIYITDTSAFLETANFRAGTTTLYEMDQPKSIDIDTEFDFWLAEHILEDWYDESN
jgi:N-acylneuraminate cytidylyltransferase/CMP-N,N'-diacetyllegionaminic acid synthase